MITNKNKIISVVFMIMTIAYSILMFVLFYRQCIGYDGNYLSDMAAYMLEAQGLESGYDFPYPIFFLMTKGVMFFTTVEWAMAITITLLNLFCVVVVRHYFRIFFKEIVENQSKIWTVKYELLVILFTFTLFFVSMLYAPRGYGFLGFDYWYRCNGSYTPNPFWNATFLAVRPFTVVCFFAGAKLLDQYEQKINTKDGLCFSIFLLLATMTKPSYTMVVMPTFFIIIVYRFIKSKGANIRESLKLGILFIPTIITLLYQYYGVFTGTNVLGEETGIGVSFAKAWSMQTMNIPLSIFMGLAFPIGVCLLNFKELKKNTWYRQGWQIMICSLVMFLMLYEKGFRFEHMNFSWGYMHGLFFVFLVSIIMLFKNTMYWYQKMKDKQDRIKIYLYRVFIFLGWCGFLWHLGCGINYFIYIMNGNNSGFF